MNPSVEQSEKYYTNKPNSNKVVRLYYTDVGVSKYIIAKKKEKVVLNSLSPMFFYACCFLM